MFDAHMFKKFYLRQSNLAVEMTRKAAWRHMGKGGYLGQCPSCLWVFKHCVDQAAERSLRCNLRFEVRGKLALPAAAVYRDHQFLRHPQRAFAATVLPDQS